AGASARSRSASRTWRPARWCARRSTPTSWPAPCARASRAAPASRAARAPVARPRVRRGGRDALLAGLGPRAFGLLAAGLTALVVALGYLHALPYAFHFDDYDSIVN